MLSRMTAMVADTLCFQQVQNICLLETHSSPGVQELFAISAATSACQHRQHSEFQQRCNLAPSAADDDAGCLDYTQPCRPSVARCGGLLREPVLSQVMQFPCTLVADRP